MSANNINPLRPTNPFVDVGQPPAQPDGSTLDTGSIQNDFTALQRARSEMRGGEQSTLNVRSQAQEQVSQTLEGETEAQNAQEEATNNQFEAIGGSNNLNALANSQETNARILYRQAESTFDPRKREVLRFEARRLEAQARENRQKARDMVGEAQEERLTADTQATLAGDLGVNNTTSTQIGNDALGQAGNFNRGASQAEINLSQLQAMEQPTTQTGSTQETDFSGPLGGVKAIINQIMALLRARGNAHLPSILTALWRNIQSLAEQGGAQLETIIANDIAEGAQATPEHQQAVLMRTQIHAVEGESKQNADAHQKTQEDYKRAEKETFEQAKRA